MRSAANLLVPRGGKSNFEEWIQSRQRTALRNPVHPDARTLPEVLRFKQKPFICAIGIIKSIYIFDGVPTWQASIMKTCETGPFSNDELNSSGRRSVRKQCERLLRGVGDSSQSEWIITEFATHLRKVLLPREVEHLSSHWLSLRPSNRR